MLVSKCFNILKISCERQFVRICVVSSLEIFYQMKIQNYCRILSERISCYMTIYMYLHLQRLVYFLPQGPGANIHNILVCLAPKK